MDSYANQTWVSGLPVGAFCKKKSCYWHMAADRRRANFLPISRYIAFALHLILSKRKPCKSMCEYNVQALNYFKHVKCFYRVSLKMYSMISKWRFAILTITIRLNGTWQSGSLLDSTILSCLSLLYFLLTNSISVHSFNKYFWSTRCARLYSRHWRYNEKDKTPFFIELTF